MLLDCRKEVWVRLLVNDASKLAHVLVYNYTPAVLLAETSPKEAGADPLPKHLSSVVWLEFSVQLFLCCN